LGLILLIHLFHNLIFDLLKLREDKFLFVSGRNMIKA